MFTQFVFSNYSNILNRSLVASFVFAVVSISATDAIRAEENKGKLILEFSGSVYSGDKQPWNQFGFNDFQAIDTNLGLNGLIGYIHPLNKFHPMGDDSWNLGVFVRYGATNKVTEGNISSPLNNILGGQATLFNAAGRVQYEEDHLIADIEARKTLGVKAQTTLNAGFRFAQFNAETNTFFIEPPGTTQEFRKSEFTGFGPKLGIEHIVPLSSNLSLDLSANASILYGRKSVDTNTIVSNPIFNNQTSQSYYDWVPTIDGRLGLTMRSPGSATALGIGVEANAWYGVYDQSAAFVIGSASNPGKRDADRFSFGPYVRLTTALGGDDQSLSAYAKNYSSEPNLERRSIFELSAWGAHLWRYGNAINSSGNPLTEIEDFSLAGVEFTAASPLFNSWLAQFEARGEATIDNNRFGALLADETYGGGHLIGGHLAYLNNNVLLGVFGGVGRTEINDNDPESLDSQFQFAGLEGRISSQHGSLAIQAGYLNSSVVDDHESFDDALFGRAIAQLFFNGGRTMLQGNIGYADGLQDADDFIPNPANILSWGVEVEHQLPVKFGLATASLFGSVEGLRVEEMSSSGDVERAEETTLLAGIKFRLGASSPYERTFNTAPNLPNITRWLGAVPAVD